MLCRAATGGYKETKFLLACKGVGVAHSTVWIPKQQNFGRGKGQCFHQVSEEGKGRRLRDAGNSGKGSGTSEETIPEGQAGEGISVLPSL